LQMQKKLVLAMGSEGGEGALEKKKKKGLNLPFAALGGGRKSEALAGGENRKERGEQRRIIGTHTQISKEKRGKKEKGGGTSWRSLFKGGGKGGTGLSSRRRKTL